MSGPHRATVRRPLSLAPDEVDDLIAFLESLTDEEIEPELKRQPSSPK